MERYDEYKESGVEWIGEIPAGWSIVPLKSLASFRKGLSITKADLSDVGKPVLSYGQIHSKRHVSSGIEKQLIRYVPESCNALAPAAFAEEGSVIFADTSEDVEGCGNCAYVDVRDGIYAGYHTIIASFRQIRGLQYFGYLFMTDAWRSQVRSLASGVKLYSITQKMLKTTSVCLPPFVERTAIADYLDAKTANVDAAISDCEREVELLQEYRKAVISEAVTKGLDPNVPMKDSGIEWIGKIPAHWKYSKLGLIASSTLGRMLDSEKQAGDCMAPYLSNRDVQWFRIDDSELKEMDFPFDSRENYEIHDGDLLICEGGEVGRCAVWHGQTPNFYFQKAIHRVRFDRAVMSSDYAAYQMYQKAQVTMFREVRKGESTIGHLPGDQLNKLTFLIPPLSEQRIIVAYLDEKTSEIDALIAGYQSMADKLREYRKSLISEAVTGKFKVPGV